MDFQSQTFGTTGSPDLSFHLDNWQLSPDSDGIKQNNSLGSTVSQVLGWALFTPNLYLA